MCKQCGTPGEHGPAQFTSRQARRLAKKQQRKRTRTAIQRNLAAAGRTTAAPARPGTTTVEFPQESEFEDPCPYCGTDGCDPEFCPDKPRKELHMVAIRLPGLDGEAPPPTKYTLTLLFPDGAKALREKLEALKQLGKITHYWVTEQMLWFPDRMDEWIQKAVGEDENGNATVNAAATPETRPVPAKATAGTVH